MKTNPSIHVSAVMRLFSDDLITAEEYTRIMTRIAEETVKDKEGEEKNG